MAVEGNASGQHRARRRHLTRAQLARFVHAVRDSDRAAATAVGGIVGAVICAPPYVLDRVGLVLLGSRTFFVLGVILLVIGVTLQAGATGTVKTVKMSATLVSGQQPAGA